MMTFQNRRLGPLLGLVVMMPLVSARLDADVVTLHSGGRLRGTYLSDRPAAEDPAGAGMTVRTLSGARITLPQSDLADVMPRSLALEQYVTRLRAADDTLAAQWQLAEWCRQANLEKRRRKHLKRVIALNPNHEQARRALGYVLHNGIWRKHADLMRARGLVKYDRRWMTPQERELIIATEDRRQKEQAWYAKIRLWHGWLHGGNSQRYRKALRKIRAISEPTAVPALSQYFQDDRNSSLRILYVGALARIPGKQAVQPLVAQYLLDVDDSVRKAALGAIVGDHGEAALPYLLKGLTHDKNKVVCRAGAALEQLGDARAVPDLIKALITTHRRTIKVPVQAPTVSFTNGKYGPGGIPLPPEIAVALRTGHLPYGVGVDTAGPPVHLQPVTIRLNVENQEVLDALQEITGESFGFDERLWQQWWMAKKSGL